MTLTELQSLFAIYVNDPFGGYFTPTIATTFLNNALIQAQRRLLKMHAAFYSVCTSTPLVIDQSQYALPSDFLALFDLWIDLDSETPPTTLPLKFIPLSQRHEFVPTSGTPTHFFMLKDSVNLVVQPDQVLTLEMIYAPKVSPMVNGSDVPDLPAQFHEYLALMAAKTAMMVDDKESKLVNEALGVYDALIVANEQRVQSQPRYIIEVS